MLQNRPLLSICIPSYNRPFQLSKLLESIDCVNFNELEIIICEDKSPQREEIINIYKKFSSNSKYSCKLFLNEINLGYDENLKELIKKSNGLYIMYMGDDDIFQSGSLDEYLIFLKLNTSLAYILRRYSIVHFNGEKEDFKYYKNHTYFEPGIFAFKALFRKSVFISGFCFKKDYVLNFYDTDKFKGTLLYQLFLCAKLVLSYPSAYCDIPITIMNESERGIPEFGNSINESQKYTPGKISIQNSINFLKSFLIITKHIDDEFGLNCSNLFIKDLSKYSYPVLSIQRDNGVLDFLDYNKKLIIDIKIHKTFYYYIYFISLLFLGTKRCDWFIINLKKILGKTPSL